MLFSKYYEADCTAIYRYKRARDTRDEVTEKFSSTKTEISVTHVVACASDSYDYESQHVSKILKIAFCKSGKRSWQRSIISCESTFYYRAIKIIVLLGLSSFRGNRHGGSRKKRSFSRKRDARCSKFSLSEPSREERSSRTS